MADPGEIDREIVDSCVYPSLEADPFWEYFEECTGKLQSAGLG